MKNKLLLFAIFIATATQVFAEHVTPERAAQVAKNFIIQKIDVTNQTNTSKTIGLNLVADDRNSENQHFYMFNLNDEQGWVIVSDDDLFIPILGYSTEGNIRIDNIPVNMKEWLDGYNREIQFGLDNDAVADEKISLQWEELYNGTSTEFANRSGVSVGPLLTTKWGQGPNNTYPYAYYNQLCPYDYEYQTRTVTGCLATAMAQVMNYWQYPEVGTGSHSYKHWRYGTQSANFGNTYYDWNNMPNYLSSTSNSIQINAVATLMYHCGVSVEMNYGVDGSGAALFGSSNTADYALKTYFGYKPTLKGYYKGAFWHDEWVNKLILDLNYGRPVIYGGHGSGGHAFVCDGYDNRNYFHFNWGGNGSYDGYFSLTALNPGQYNFTSNQQAIFGIEPQYATIHTGNTPSYQSPFDNYYKYSWNEMIYPKSYFPNPCTINSVSFYCTNDSYYTCRNLDIYMSKRPSDAHASTSDWINPSNLQLVYSASGKVIGDQTGWQEFVLDTPYDYYPDENLVVVVAKAGYSWTDQLKWSCSGIHMSLCRQSDTNSSIANSYPNGSSGQLVPQANVKFSVEYGSQPSVITIGNGTTASYSSPFDNYYKYSWNESIYPSSSLPSQCTITSVSYNCKQASYYTCKNLDIYMGVINKSQHNSTSDWINPSSLRLVYSGSGVVLGRQTGWQDFVLDSPFEYSGNGNLVIVVAKAGYSWTDALKWECEGTNNKSLCLQSDRVNVSNSYPNGQNGVYAPLANVKLGLRNGRSGKPTVYQEIEISENSKESEMANVEEINGVNIFPNPAQNVINIEMEDNNFEYTLYNELGQVVRQGKSCGKSQINVEDCQKGLYLIKIATEEKTSTHKIVIE